MVSTFLSLIGNFLEMEMAMIKLLGLLLGCPPEKVSLGSPQKAAFLHFL